MLLTLSPHPPVTSSCTMVQASKVQIFLVTPLIRSPLGSAVVLLAQREDGMGGGSRAAFGVSLV